MKQKIIITLACLVWIAGNITAQKESISYAVVGLQTGFSSLGFNVQGLDGIAGQTTSKMGFGVSIRYNYYFDKHWGFGTGLGLSVYNANALLYGGMDDVNRYSLGNYTDDDDSGLPQLFTLRARIENIKEKQNIQFFEIPVTVLYQTRFSYGKWGAYGCLGIKLQLPIVKKYEVVGFTDSQLNVSGLYTHGTQGFEIGAPGMPALPYHGFGTVDNPGKALGWKNNNTAVKFGIAGTFEAGAISRLNPESDFLFGLFLDYGFSDIKNKSDALLSGPSDSYHPDANDHIGKGIVYNGLLNSNHTDKIKPLSFGVKLGLRFKL